MSRRYGFAFLIAAVGVLALTVSVSTTHGRPSAAAPTTVSITYDEDAGVFRGRVSSRNAACRARRTVELVEIADGRSTTVARTRTDRRGNWRIAYRPEGRLLSGVMHRLSSHRGRARGTARCRTGQSRSIPALQHENLGCRADTQNSEGLPTHDDVVVGLCQQPINRVRIRSAAPITNFSGFVVFIPNGAVREGACERQSPTTLNCPITPPMSQQEIFGMLVDGLPPGTAVNLDLYSDGFRHQEMTLMTE